MTHRQNTCLVCLSCFVTIRVAKYCCKKCANAAWYRKNSGHRLLKNKSYRDNEENKARAYNLTHEWIQANSDKMKRYRRSNRDKFAARKKERYHSDIEFKLINCIRSRTYHALSAKKSKSTIELLGCSIDELKNYLEAKFQPGMTWGNWGRGKNKWHIDHIKPLSVFSLSNESELKKACHYSNLQPLWEKENLSKGNKYE